MGVFFSKSGLSFLKKRSSLSVRSPLMQTLYPIIDAWLLTLDAGAAKENIII